MLIYYNGPLGAFQYNDTEFIEKSGTLRYIGKETDGSKIKIPEGIVVCNHMFTDCNIVTPPVIPETAKFCILMFDSCAYLTEAPVIPQGVEDVDYIFYNCGLLRNFVLCPKSAQYYYGQYQGCSSILQEINNFVIHFYEKKKSDN